jgi:hypothetical protein
MSSHVIKRENFELAKCDGARYLQNASELRFSIAIRLSVPASVARPEGQLILCRATGVTTDAEQDTSPRPTLRAFFVRRLAYLSGG